MQFPTRARIVSQQNAGWLDLVRAVHPHNRFYAEKWQGVDVAGLELRELGRLPFTTKSELVQDQEAHPPFGTNLTFPLDRYTRFHQTSGTTGTPLRCLDTPESWDWMVERWREILIAADVTAADRMLFAFSFGPFIGFWLAFEAGGRVGALCLPAGGLGSLGRLRMILDNQATVLCCTPTYALRLAQAAQEEQIDLRQARVRRIIVAGEPGGSIPATRTQLEALWPGARVFDHHGMTETGPVTFECPARPGFLHVMESGFVAEVIDSNTGQAVAQGEPGELVLTTLGRIGYPLIRYRTGDLVKIETAWHEGRACACGRHDIVLEGGIIGRVDDMVIVRGVNVYPTAVDTVLRSCPGIAEYQVQVTRDGALAELRVLIEPDAGCPDAKALLVRVIKALQQAFALRIPVELAAIGSLPRFDMKAKRWVHLDSGAHRGSTRTF